MHLQQFYVILHKYPHNGYGSSLLISHLQKTANTV